MKRKLFGRTIVGFDLRRGSTLNNVFLTSYDEVVRYEDLNEKFHDYQSGINLFAVDPTAIPSLALPSDARIVAFDLPTSHVAKMIEQGVSSPEPLPNVDLDSGWHFLGFDVVDPRTQTSAFYGLAPRASISQISATLPVRLNRNGLVPEEKKALDVARYFDDGVPEHAPFVPCGVWLKDRSVQARNGS